MRIETKLNRTWYEGDPVPLWAWPLSVLFRLVVGVRRAMFHLGVLRSRRLPVPVVVVGNIAVGGTGKSPLTIALVEAFRSRNLECGIVSRGYGGNAGRVPLIVDSADGPERTGDEALMLARRTGVPVCIHPRRALAAEALLSAARVDVILCDDGLQHYALARDIEIAVVDGERRLGNRRMLPAGPLREPASRLQRVDYVVVNGDADAFLPDADDRVRDKAHGMRLTPKALVNLATGERRDPDALVGQRGVAVAGIGNPQRFFRTLGELGYSAECRAFPDHHRFVAEDLSFSEKRPVLMTEKDAVKCRPFAQHNWWYLEVGAVLEPAFVDRLAEQVNALRAGSDRSK